MKSSVGALKSSSNVGGYDGGDTFMEHLTICDSQFITPFLDTIHLAYITDTYLRALDSVQGVSIDNLRPGAASAPAPTTGNANKELAMHKSAVT